MKFCWTTLQVKNMEESLQFYQEVLGLKLMESFDAGPDTRISFLGEGETRIELIDNKKVSQVNFGQDISLGFEAESLEKVMELLKEKQIPIHSGPFEPNPHVRFFYVLDPNGLKIQFVEHR